VSKRWTSCESTRAIGRSEVSCYQALTIVLSGVTPTRKSFCQRGFSVPSNSSSNLRNKTSNNQREKSAVDKSPKFADARLVLIRTAQILIPSCRLFKRSSIQFDPVAQQETEFNILARTMRNQSFQRLGRTRKTTNLSQAVRQQAVASRAADAHHVQHAVQLVGRLP
jgi:hypothetical protein